MSKDTDQINKILDQVRPGIQADGGDVSLRSFKNGIATLQIKGACVGCPMARLTFEDGIGRIIKDKVKNVKDIKYVSF